MAEMLTGRQQGFARMVAAGSTLRDAYAANYSVDAMKPANIYQAASKLMDNPAVAAAVKGMVEQKTNALMMADRTRVRQYVFDRLIKESGDPENPPAARIRAAELLGKVKGVDLFGGGEERAPRETAELEAALKAKLAAMLSTGLSEAKEARD